MEHSPGFIEVKSHVQEGGGNGLGITTSPTKDYLHSEAYLVYKLILNSSQTLNIISDTEVNRFVRNGIELNSELVVKFQTF